MFQNVVIHFGEISGWLLPVYARKANINTTKPLKCSLNLPGFKTISIIFRPDILCFTKILQDLNWQDFVQNGYILFLS